MTAAGSSAQDKFEVARSGDMGHKQKANHGAVLSRQKTFPPIGALSPTGERGRLASFYIRLSIHFM